MSTERTELQSLMLPASCKKKKKIDKLKNANVMHLRYSKFFKIEIMYLDVLPLTGRSC